MEVSVPPQATGEERREEARGQAIHPYSSSDGNIESVEKAEEKKEPAIKTGSPTSEEAEEQVAEPSAVPSIPTARKSTTDSASTRHTRKECACDVV